MTVRLVMARSLAIAATIAVVATPLAAQQDTTRLRRTTSDTRIGVAKGEVALPPRVDTVHSTRYDTVRIRETVVRVDTVVVTVAAPVIPKVLGDWYWSMFAGATAPINLIDRLNTNGYHVGGGVGWEPKDSWFGARLIAAWNQVGREQGRAVGLVGTRLPSLWQVAMDLKAKGNVGGWSPYILGGLGFNSYKRLATVSDSDDDLIVQPPIALPVFPVEDADDIEVCGVDGKNGCYRLATDQWRTKFSWDFGAGLDFHIGSQDMFLEWRFNPIQTHGAYTWYMPITLGLRYF